MKKITIITLAVLCVALLCVAAACEPEDELPQKYKITCASGEGYSVSDLPSESAEGSTVYFYVEAASVFYQIDKVIFNGTEIYEGDIVKIDDELVWGSMTSCGMEYDSVSVETHALIGWIDEDCAFGITRTNLGDGECDSQFLFDISPDGNEEKLAEKIRHTEVVGNIHDNPELMEEAQA